METTTKKSKSKIVIIILSVLLVLTIIYGVRATILIADTQLIVDRTNLILEEYGVKDEVDAILEGAERYNEDSEYAEGIDDLSEGYSEEGDEEYYE